MSRGSGVAYLVAIAVQQECTSRGASRVARLPRATAARAARPPRAHLPAPPRATRHHAHAPASTTTTATTTHYPGAEAAAGSRTTPVSMCFVRIRRRGGEDTHRAGRGADPARCVTHLSRCFLACSRSPPSAETCPERRPPPAAARPPVAARRSPPAPSCCGAAKLLIWFNNLATFIVQ